MINQESVGKQVGPQTPALAVTGSIKSPPRLSGIRDLFKQICRTLPVSPETRFAITKVGVKSFQHPFSCHLRSHREGAQTCQMPWIKKNTSCIRNGKRWQFQGNSLKPLAISRAHCLQLSKKNRSPQNPSKTTALGKAILEYPETNRETLKLKVVTCLGKNTSLEGQKIKGALGYSKSSFCYWPYLIWTAQPSPSALPTRSMGTALMQARMFPAKTGKKKKKLKNHYQSWRGLYIYIFQLFQWLFEDVHWRLLSKPIQFCKYPAGWQVFRKLVVFLFSWGFFNLLLLLKSMPQTISPPSRKMVFQKALLVANTLLPNE